MKNRIIRIPRRWLRKTLRENRTVGLTLPGVGLKIGWDAKDEPVETRTSFDADDASPFYESDPDVLRNYYHGYAQSRALMNNVLYVDLVPLQAPGASAIALDAVPVDELSVTVAPVSYRLPELLAEHADLTIDFFKKTGRVRHDPRSDEYENDQTLRIDSIDPEGRRIVASNARFFDQVATNLTLDWATGALGRHRTIRIGVERPDAAGKLIPLEASNLANTLGVAVTLFNRDLNPYLRIRSDSLASIADQSLHCTASGVFSVGQRPQPPGEYSFSLLRQGMVREIEQEIGLAEHEYALFPIAFARELPRGGKPQLFFIAIALVDDARVVSAMQTAEEAFEFVGTAEEAGTISEQDVASANFTYEGWASYLFAEDFIEANAANLPALIGQP